VPPPFNVLILPLVLVFACVTNKKTIKRINEQAVFIFYLPIAFILTLAFMVVNLVLLPFAYVYVFYSKLIALFLMCIPVNKRSTDKPKTCTYILIQIANFFIWLVFGVLMLTVSQIRDTWYFTK
jgi:hypothetical protein